MWLECFFRAGIHSGSSEDEDVNMLDVPSEVVFSDSEDLGSVEPSHGPHPQAQMSGPHMAQYNDPSTRLLRQCLKSVSSVILY